MIKSSFFNTNIVLFFYTLFFFFFFLSFPLNNSLISEGDSWYYVGKFNYFLNTLYSYFFNEPYSQYFYPDSKPFLNGEPSFGLFLIWLIYKLVLNDEVWCYFLLIVTIFTLNSISVNLLVRNYVKNINGEVALLSGLFFSCNMFMFANIENINTLFIAPGIFAVYLFYRLINNEVVIKKREAILFVGLMLLQLVSSVYNFCYVLIFLLSIVLIHRKTFFQNIVQHKLKWSSIIASGFVLSLAYILFIIIFADKKSTHWNFSSGLYVVKIFSITLDDFFRVLPHTLYNKGNSGSLILNYQSFFLGFTFIILTCVGIYRSKLRFKEFYIALFLSIIIGIGTYIQVNGQVILMPLGLLYEKLNAYSYFRFPYRILLLIVLLLSILASIGLDFIVSRTKFRIIILLVAFAFFIENIPFKRSYTNFNIYYQEGQYIKSILNETNQNILLLPAGDLMNRDGMIPRMNETVYVFMYWQTIIKRNILNGNSGFLPPHIVELNDAIYKSEDPYESLVSYCLKYDVDMVIHYGDSWNFDTFPLDSNLLEPMLVNEGIRYLKR